MSSSVSTVNGTMYVSHVYPEQNAPAVSATGTVPTVSPVLGTFLKGEPKALGTVQIMIGVLKILFGMVVFSATSAIVSILFGGIIYIITGSLTVAAGNKLTRTLVKVSLGMNIFNTIIAGIAMIQYTSDFMHLKDIHIGLGDCDSDKCHLFQQLFLSRAFGTSGVLLVFSFLEFIISISVSAFACKATCHSRPEPVQMFFQNPGYQNFLPVHVPAPAPNASGPAMVPHNSDFLTRNKPEDMPPMYTTIQE